MTTETETRRVTAPEARNIIFRQRLVAIVSALHDGDARDPEIRRRVGTYAHRIVRQAGARNWTDLKRRADAGTYDSLLALFQRESEAFQKAGDGKGVRVLEALALSLIARHQKQATLTPGVGFLDRFIDGCAALVRPTAKVVVNAPGTARR